MSPTHGRYGSLSLPVLSTGAVGVTPERRGGTDWPRLWWISLSHVESHYGGPGDAPNNDSRDLGRGRRATHRWARPAGPGGRAGRDEDVRVQLRRADHREERAAGRGAEHPGHRAG